MGVASAGTMPFRCQGVPHMSNAFLLLVVLPSNTPLCFSVSSVVKNNVRFACVPRLRFGLKSELVHVTKIDGGE
jgi:hypothetical protein